MPLEDFIIYVYCCVAENYEELTKERPLRKCGYSPKLSDSEVITMEIVGEFMGKDQDKSMWQYFQSHWKPWFPNLGSRSNFAKQCANLWKIKEQIARRLVAQMGEIKVAFIASMDFQFLFAKEREQAEVDVLKMKQAIVIVQPKKRNIMGSRDI